MNPWWAIIGIFLVGCGGNNNSQRLDARASLEYWERLSKIEKRLEYTPGQGVQTGSDAKKIGDQTASEIERLSTIDVDRELVDFAIEVAAQCRKWGQFVDANYSGSALFSRGLQGFTGSVTGDFKTAPENDQRIESERQSLIESTNQIRTKGARLRARLSQTFGTEFPVIEF